MIIVRFPTFAKGCLDCRRVKGNLEFHVAVEGAVWSSTKDKGGAARAEVFARGTPNGMTSRCRDAGSLSSSRKRPPLWWPPNLPHAPPLRRAESDIFGPRPGSASIRTLTSTETR